MNRWILTLASLWLFGAPQASAYVSDYTVGFGPFVGGGEVSSGAAVRHTSGYTVSLERNWQILPKLSIGPRFEITNAFVNTKETSAVSGGEAKSIATYDNRIFAAGVRLSRSVGGEHTLAQGTYLTAVAGRAYSKLSIDDSTETSFTQSMFGNISGDYFAGELGGFIPLKGSFGINLAMLGSIYRADQSQRQGTVAEDGVDASGKGYSLTQPTETTTDGLDDRIVMKTWAARVGIQVGF